MRRTLSSHTNDEDLEKFDWPQWQALKLKQMRQFREHNRGLIDECEKEVKKETKKILLANTSFNDKYTREQSQQRSNKGGDIR